LHDQELRGSKRAVDETRAVAERTLVLKTKSIYDDKKEDGDGVRLLVTRYYPRGVCGSGTSHPVENSSGRTRVVA
jgi:hypothetical protein